MAEQFESHADRARRGQWLVKDMPWDEPLRLCGENKREQTLCKLNMVDVVTAMYHLQLGARGRLGRHMVQWWEQDDAMLSCMEWHDADEQRHVQVLRRLLAAVSSKGETVTRNDRPLHPKPLWEVTRGPSERLGPDRLLLHMLIDEAVSRALFAIVARDSHVPLVRAVFDACAQDDGRHVDYLTSMAALRYEGVPSYVMVGLHASAVWHVSRLQGALRPYLSAFAGVTHSSQDRIVTTLFGAASRALGELGEGWKSAPLVKLVHGADHSPWMLWVLR